jgi:hypothetical protein
MPQVKQGGITVDAAHELSVPANHHTAALERNARVDETVQAAQHSRRNKLAAIKAEQPSGNSLPALHGLKPANHVHEVFKKR